ncbi:MAG TPA: hypothetical protein VFF73_21400, partial [Planctomycetota bacterium]|nr:hypothetical protein [Planctomycetota bacterium]
TLQPRHAANKTTEMIAGHDVERASQSVAGASPRPDFADPEHSPPTEPSGTEGVMCDHISPFIELLDPSPPRARPSVVRLDCVPEGRDPESFEVALNRIRACIAAIELARSRKVFSNDPPDRRRRDDGADQEVTGLALEVTAESLEVRRKDQRVTLIDLLRRPSLSPDSMGILELVESSRAHGQPET